MNQFDIERAFAERQARNRAAMGLPDGGWSQEASRSAMSGGLLSPQSQGLLGLAAGLMAPTRGGTFGGAFANGIQGYQSAYGNAQQMANDQDRLKMAREKYAFEMEGAKKKRDEQAELERLSMRYLGLTPHQDARQVTRKDAATGVEVSTVAKPGLSEKPRYDDGALREIAAKFGPEYAQQLQSLVTPAPRKTTVVNGRLVDSQTGEEIANFPEAPKPTAFENDLRAAGIDPASPEGQKLMRDRLSKSTTHAPAASVNVSPTVNTNLPAQETEQSKTYGKAMGDIRANIMQAGLQAPTVIRQYEQLGAALSGLEGGNLSGAKTSIASALNSFGVNIDPRLGDKEFAESMAREVAASMRQTGTGPMTDKDFENFLKRVPDLSKSEAGRKQIIETAIAKAKRDQQVAQMAMQYAAKNGGVIDDQFLVQVSQFVDSNPVVMQAPEPGKVEFGDGWSMRPVQ